MADDEVAAGLALLDEAMVAVVAGELTPMFTGLVYCTAIANYHRMFAFDRAREWTSAFDDWCKSQPQVAVFSSVTILNGTPDLLLVTIICVALLRGSIVGAAAGFWGGLLLDVANLATLGVTSSKIGRAHV